MKVSKQVQKEINKEMLKSHSERPFNWISGFYSTSKLAVHLSTKLRRTLPYTDSKKLTYSQVLKILNNESLFDNDIWAKIDYILPKAPGFTEQDLIEIYDSQY